MAARDLTGLPICITGASSGIGRATAVACAAAGMPVVASARRERALDELVREIREAGGRAEAVVADVREEGSGERLVEACGAAFGPVYAVFANAGYGYEAAQHETGPGRVREIFETNFFGTLRVIDAALPGMIDRRSGHVLVCSSCLSVLPTPYYGAYTATKAAQHHVASAMRFELRGHGVSVTSVHPVSTRTEFFDEARRRSVRARFLARAGGASAPPPERVAGAVVRALRRPRPEAWTSAPARIVFALAALSPRARDAVIGRVAARRLREPG